MSYRVRATTIGNQRADYTQISKSFTNLPPAIQSTVRNAVPQNGLTPEKGDIGGTDTVNQYKLQRLSDVISNNINAVTDLRAITPYVDKAELIWNTILLYPNGKQERILTYDTLPSQFKNNALHLELLKVWEEYFTNDYRIEEELSKIINDILWNTGSYVLFNLSRPGLDYLINGSEFDPKKAREGTEAFMEYRNKSLEELRREFVEVNGQVRAKNIGKMIRDPNAPEKSKVSGLEAILSGGTTEAGLEFNLFGSDVDPDNDMGITFTDNPAVLYFQKLKEKDRINHAHNVMGAENLDLMIDQLLTQPEAKDPKDPITDKDTKVRQKKAEPSEATTKNLDEPMIAAAARELYRARNIHHQSMQFVKPIDTLSVAPYGRGLTWHIPSEAVIPIHYNGQNKRQGDFIFLIDPEEGTFLKNTADPEYYQSVNKTKNGIGNKNKAGSENNLISSLRVIQEGKECEFDMSEFVDIAKKSIIKQFTSAILSDKAENISITIDEETNKIFLSRLFRRQGVRCLYVPGEAVTYMALKFSRLGTGQSLTQLAKMHIARLAAFDVADALANLEAAQPHTLMTLTHGKEDGDPNNTVAIARAAFYDQNPKLHSMLASAQLSVPSIVNALKDSSLTVKINAGDNPLVAAPEIDMQQMEKNYFKPVADESRQKVLNDISNYFFTPRSWLDVSDDQNNFKIEAITEHEMVTNQAVNWQAALAEFIVDFQKKHTRVNAPLLTKLIQCIKDNKKYWKPDNAKEAIAGDDGTVIKTLLADFFVGVKVSFPEPTSMETTDKLKNQLDSIQALVEKWMEMAGDGIIMDSIVKTLGLNTEMATPDEINKHVKAYFYAEAFKKFNIPMPFDEIVNDGKGGGIASLVHGIVHQQVNMQEFVVAYLTEKQKATKDFIKKNQTKLQKLFDEQPEVPEGEPQLDADGNPIPGTEDVPGDDNAGGGYNPFGGDAQTDDSVPGDDDVPPGDDDTPPGDDSGASGDTPTEPDDDAGDSAGGKGSNDPSSPNYDPFTGGKA